MPRGELAVDHGDAVAPAHRHQMRERHFGGIAHPAEHRFPEEYAPEPHPIETADELAAEPRLDAVRMPPAMELEVSRTHLRRDPRAQAVGPRRGAAVDDTCEILVRRDGEAGIAQGFR